MSYKIAAFYRFTPVPDTHALAAEINAFGKTVSGLCGTILLAPEGINGTIGAHPDSMDKIIEFLDKKTGIVQGELKYSSSEKTPFNRFKVRPKKEIITMKRPEADPNKQVGDYIGPEGWHALLNDPEVTVIDT